MLNLSLGEIVSKYPNTISVLNKYKLDYCCGGKDILKNALDELNLNKEQIVLEIMSKASNQRKEEVIEWKKESLSTVIDYILDVHHVFMRDTLDELNGLVFKILKAHFKSHQDLVLELHSTFGQLKTELEAHLVKEEEQLFPLIRAYEFSGSQETLNQVYDFIHSTEDEHDAAGDLFKSLARLTNDYLVPEDVCVTFERVYKLLDALEKDTFNHIHMENSVLFTML